uniref:Calponin-homology (CH) domain-containing protein n=2 Tax=Guillardia theta TaxID=55529 RepID=A0A7S4PMP5_GUITH|mmetsp:Transcript_6955/g.24365  ORF Transcript_6955/g.24365 Transcript_6955/m.24365 type:complete len:934 (+) Transcript_6955:237-3038(+)
MEQLDTMVRSLEEKFETLSANVELYQVPTLAITEGLEKIGKREICKMSPNNNVLHDLVQDCCTLMDRVENALTAIVHQETGYAESFLGGNGAGGSECNKSSSPSTTGFLLESSLEWTDTSSTPNTSQTSGSQNSSQSYLVSNRYLSKSQVLSWAGTMLDDNFEDFQSLEDGCVFGRLLDRLFYGKFPLEKLWIATTENGMKQNFKVIQAFLLKNQCNYKLKMEKLCKRANPGKSSDECYKLYQWISSRFEKCQENRRKDASVMNGHYFDMEIPYDPHERKKLITRKESLLRSPAKKKQGEQEGTACRRCRGCGHTKAEHVKALEFSPGTNRKSPALKFKHPACTCHMQEAESVKEELDEEVSMFLTPRRDAVEEHGGGNVHQEREGSKEVEGSTEQQKERGDDMHTADLRRRGEETGTGGGTTKTAGQDDQTKELVLPCQRQEDGGDVRKECEAEDEGEAMLGKQSRGCTDSIYLASGGMEVGTDGLRSNEEGKEGSDAGDSCHSVVEDVNVTYDADDGRSSRLSSSTDSANESEESEGLADEADYNNEGDDEEMRWRLVQTGRESERSGTLSASQHDDCNDKWMDGSPIAPSYSPASSALSLPPSLRLGANMSSPHYSASPVSLGLKKLGLGLCLSSPRGKLKRLNTTVISPRGGRCIQYKKELLSMENSETSDLSSSESFNSMTPRSIVTEGLVNEKFELLNKSAAPEEVEDPSPVHAEEDESTGQNDNPQWLHGTLQETALSSIADCDSSGGSQPSNLERDLSGTSRKSPGLQGSDGKAKEEEGEDKGLKFEVSCSLLSEVEESACGRREDGMSPEEVQLSRKGDEAARANETGVEGVLQQELLKKGRQEGDSGVREEVSEMKEEQSVKERDRAKDAPCIHLGHGVKTRGRGCLRQFTLLAAGALGGGLAVAISLHSMQQGDANMMPLLV